MAFFIMLRIIVKIVLIVLFIGFGNFISHYLVIAGFSWISAIIAHYVLLILLLFGAFGALFHNGKTNYKSALLFSGFHLICLIALLYAFKKGIGFQKYSLFILLYSLFWSADLIVSFIYRSSEKVLNLNAPTLQKFLTPLFSIISIGGACMIKIPYQEDFTHFEPGSISNTDTTILKKIHEHTAIDLADKQNYLLCFFTSDCPHCLRAAQQIEASVRKGGFPEVFTIIGGSDQRVEYFLSRTCYSGKYEQTLDENWFFSTTGGSVPMVFEVENNRIVSVWNGLMLNYLTLDSFQNE